MRYPASEKAEIIRLVERSASSARKTLDRLGVPRATFYRWYDQYRTGGPEALEDRPSQPSRVWNRIPEVIRSRIVDLALLQTELSYRELSEEAGRSLRNVGASNDKPSNTGACNTAKSPPSINQPDGPNPPLKNSPTGLKWYDDVQFIPYSVYVREEP